MALRNLDVGFNEGGSSASCLDRNSPKEKALNSLWVESWLNFRAGLPVVNKILFSQ
jgi:hypothetical protein